MAMKASVTIVVLAALALGGCGGSESSDERVAALEARMDEWEKAGIQMGLLIRDLKAENAALKNEIDRVREEAEIQQQADMRSLSEVHDRLDAVIHWVQRN